MVQSFLHAGNAEVAWKVPVSVGTQCRDSELRVVSHSDRPWVHAAAPVPAKCMLLMLSELWIHIDSYLRKREIYYLKISLYWILPVYKCLTITGNCGIFFENYN